MTKDLAPKMHPQQTKMTVLEYDQLVALLGKVDPDERFGTPLFDQLLRVKGGTSFEGVMLRRGPDDDPSSVEVYLTKRGPNETFYPGEWHAPGAFFLKDERPVDAANRLASREYKLSTGFSTFSHVYDHFHTTPRGYIESKIYVVSVPKPFVLPEGPDRGWFSVRALPVNTVDVHREVIIPVAVRGFLGQS